VVDVIRGKYRIVREIARSNDIVYEAVDASLGRRIALKELNFPPGMTGQPRRERIERFNREARAAGRLSHPNIVSVFDFGEENGRHFIAMEYLEGQNLRDMMQVRGALPLKEALDIIYQVLDALAYAHANRVVHRDIKPDNIHMLPGGQVKLTDFGIARLTEEPAMTSNGQVFGTPSYMSPEQIEGRSSIDHRSDLFSVGIVLYEMLAGRKPFVGDSVVSITYAIMNAEAPPMPGTPMGIENVVRRALAKQPMQRPASAEQMKLDLRTAEQTPAAFFSPATGMTNLGQTGLGYTGMGLSTGYGAPVGSGYASPNPGYAPAAGGYAGAVTPPSPPAGGNGSLPWAWNGAPPGGNGAGSPQLPAQAPPVGMQPGAGVAPNAFPARPAEPLFVLPPGVRTTLIAVAVAAVLGGCIAAGIVGFFHSYDQYKVTATAQRITTLINQGATAYNKGDYATAAKLFDQARAANPDAGTRTTLDFNLTATYIQLARQAAANNNVSEAEDDYHKALEITPDNKQAHAELAALLDRQGDTAGAGQERAAAEIGSDQQLPTSLNGARVGSGTGADTTNNAGDQSLDSVRGRARDLINQGMQLFQQGQVEKAHEKWQEAIGVAPGTPERDKAMELINSTPTAPSPPPSDFGFGG
jgi:serine/threonine-protein kinase